MANAKKLESGSWRTQVYSHTDIINGKKIRRYESFTADTKKESEYLAAEFAHNKRRKSKPGNLTVGEAIDKYIELKDGVLAPSTIASYRRMRRCNLQGLMCVKIKDVDKGIVQNEVNKEAKLVSERTGKPLSAKTIANAHGLVYSALDMFAPEIILKTTLPSRQKRISELPLAEDVFALVVGTNLERPCMLSMWLSYSMSEIMGIKVSAISNDGYITIKEVVVEVEGKSTPKSRTKEFERTRRAKVPPYILALIKKEPTYIKHKQDGTDGYLFTIQGRALYKRFVRRQKKMGFPHMRFHDLRGLNASVMLKLKIPDKYAMERGGWKTDHVMKEVYQKTLSDERLVVDSQINAYFEGIVSKEISHEMQHGRFKTHKLKRL